MRMFQVEGNTINLSIGDTGSVDFTASGYTFAPEDRALFTIKSATGQIIFEKLYALTNGKFTVEFKNSTTDQLAQGAYSYDVRYIIHPYYDESGRAVSGDQVITPNRPMTLNLINVVGEV